MKLTPGVKSHCSDIESIENITKLFSLPLTMRFGRLGFDLGKFFQANLILRIKAKNLHIQ